MSTVVSPGTVVATGGIVVSLVAGLSGAVAGGGVLGSGGGGGGGIRSNVQGVPRNITLTGCRYSAGLAPSPAPSVPVKRSEVRLRFQGQP